MEKVKADRVPLKTIQIAKWRLVKESDVFFNIALKGGVSVLAPLPLMLFAIKRGEMDQDTYRGLYVKLMLERIRNNPLHFRELFLEALGEKSHLVLGCYCRPETFCHRYILIHDVLPLVQDLLGIKFEYKGEVT